MIERLRHLGLTRMRPRDPREPGRTASSLELFFDLAFVVCVSVAADHLLAREEVGEWGSGVAAYLAVFFAVWWAWTTVTWFGSAYATDDWLYRATTFVQTGGVLVLAAGVGPAFDRGDYRTIVAGWVVMRLSLVAQWLRSARVPDRRRRSLRTAAATSAVQVLWAAWALAPLPVSVRVPSGLGLLLLELLIPVWTTHGVPPPWHPHHLAERHGLFTLIVLGEGLLSSARAAIDLQDGDVPDGGRLALFGGTGLVLLAGLWWVYFSREAHLALTTERRMLTFGYAHYAVFASAGAVAAGLELGIAAATQAVPDPAVAVRAATTVPVAVFVLASWAVVLRRSLGRWTRRTVPCLAVAAGASALLPRGVQVCALVVVATVVVLEVDGRRGRDVPHRTSEEAAAAGGRARRA